MTPFRVMPIGIARGWGMKEINSAIFHYLHWTLHQTCYHLDNFLWCSYLYLEWSMRLHVRRRLFLFIDSELTFGFPPKIPDCSSLECHFTCLSTYLENMGDPPVLHNNFMKNKPWSRNSWRMTKCRWLSNQVIYKPWDHTHIRISIFVNAVLTGFRPITYLSKAHIYAVWKDLPYPILP